MKGARGWVVMALVAAIIAAAVYFVQPRQDSPEHSSNSDAANGTSAALLFAQAIGHPIDQVTGTFGQPATASLMFVFSPTSAYTADEAQRIRLWVRSGGVLVYAAEQGDAELDRAFAVTRNPAEIQGGQDAATPVLAGVSLVAGGDLVQPLEPGPEQVPMLRAPGGQTVAYIQQVGAGSVVVLADPLVLCNGYLDRADNGRLLADLLGLPGAGAPVRFDEYHHGVRLSDLTPQAWVTTPWGAGLLWLLIAVFAGLLLRGRSFGPLIPKTAEVARADAEWAVAVGQLLRRSSARAITLGLLASATERSVAARTGIPVQPRERFWNALWVRVPEVAAALAEAENALYGSAADEAGVLKAAQRLHQIAHPVADQRRRTNPAQTKEA